MPARQAKTPGLVCHFHDEDLSFLRTSKSGSLEGGVCFRAVFDKHVDVTVLVPRHCAHPLDVHPCLTEGRAEQRQLTRLMRKDRGQVCGYGEASLSRDDGDRHECVSPG